MHLPPEIKRAFFEAAFEPFLNWFEARSGSKYAVREVQFQPAHVAVYAAIGHVAELFAGEAVEFDPAGQHAADQVGLCPRGGLLGRREAEDRTHPHFGRLRATVATAIAVGGGAGDAGGIPIQL